MNNPLDDFYDSPSDELDFNDPRNRLSLPLNDLGNGKRLIAALKNDVLVLNGQYAAWDGTRYNVSSGPERVLKLAECLPTMIEEEAACSAQNPIPDQEINEYCAANGESDRAIAERRLRAQKSGPRRTFARNSGNAPKLKNALEMAKHAFIRDHRDLDADQDRLQVKNGTLLLSKIADVPDAEDVDEKRNRWAEALIEPHDRSHLPTRVAGCEFDPNATAPEWERFVECAMPDPATRTYFQAVMGLLLHGQEDERFVVFQGAGGNGKSTAVKALTSTMGSFSEPCRIEMFCEQRGGPSTGPTPEEAILPGARVYVASEPDTGVTLSAGKLKGLTGGDERQANPKNRALFSYRPIGVPLLQVNRLPNVNDPSKGFWRRLVIVAFEQNLDELPKQDRRSSSEMARAIDREKSGILNWLLDGYAIYRIDGLHPPERIKELKGSLQGLSDPVGEFLRDCTVAMPSARVRTSHLHKAFVEWSEAQGNKPVGNRAFTSQMLALEFQKIKSKDWFWVGIDVIGDTGEAGEFR